MSLVDDLKKKAEEETREKGETAFRFDAEQIKKNLVGRPTKYTAKYINALADEMVSWFSIPTNIWLKDFAINKGFSTPRIEEFAKKSKKFSSALSLCKDMQESKLFKLGLSKKYNFVMAIMALKNVSEWRDNQKIDVSGAIKTTDRQLTKKEVLGELEQLLVSGGLDGNTAKDFVNAVTGTKSNPSVNA